MTSVPETSYGVSRQSQCGSRYEEMAEQVRGLGYAVLDAGYTAAEFAGNSSAFERTRQQALVLHFEAQADTGKELP